MSRIVGDSRIVYRNEQEMRQRLLSVVKPVQNLFHVAGLSEDFTSRSPPSRVEVEEILCHWKNDGPH